MWAGGKFPASPHLVLAADAVLILYGVKAFRLSQGESRCASALLVVKQCLGGRDFGRRLGVLGGALFLQRLSGLLRHRLSRRLISHRRPLGRGAWLVPIV